MFARIYGGSLLAFAPRLERDPASSLGHLIAARVRELRIHDLRSARLRYKSANVGVCAAVAEGQEDCNRSLQRAQVQLQQAKQAGCKQAA